MDSVEVLLKLDQFEGPLDLLVYLVQRKRIDVRQLSISQLADEFIFYLRQMEELNLTITSEFIATAAYLMELKSKSLLPSLSEREKREYERKRELLLRRIEDYARLKEVALEVQRWDAELDAYPVRVHQSFPNVDERKLVKLLRAALQEVEVRRKVYVIRKDKYSVERLMNEIEKNYDELDLLEFLRDSESRYELVVRFLAILELVRFEKYLLLDDLKLKRASPAGT